MARVLVAGSINIETTVPVEGFPIDYQSQHFLFFGLRTTVSGVGYNVARALTKLGHEVVLLSLIGRDLNGQLARVALAEAGIDGEHVLAVMPETVQSAILYDPSGRRQGYTDLKDIQERAYPLAAFRAVAPACDVCVLCNINFARGLLGEAQRLGKLIATDVHTISDPDDAFNRDFMAAADILFMSGERLPEPPEAWVQTLAGRYGPAVQVVGLGEAGALLRVAKDGYVGRVPAVRTRPVVNTIGAGDALFSAFVHGYLQTGDPVAALRGATVYASWKVGGNGGADGLLTAAELARLVATLSTDSGNGFN